MTREELNEAIKDEVEFIKRLEALEVALEKQQTRENESKRI